MSKILITGNAGFIGGCFVKGLLEETDHEVRGIDILNASSNALTMTDYLGHPRLKQLSQGDIADWEDVIEHVDWADIVVSFAAETHVDRSIGTWELDGNEFQKHSVTPTGDFIRSNYVGVAVLLEACLEKGIDKFIQVSTDEVYGEVPSPKLSMVGDALDPTNIYAATKAGAEFLALSYFKTYGLPVVVTRSANNYGPYQSAEKFIPVAILQALAEEPIPIYGNGLQLRDWIWVVDNCAVIMDMMHHAPAGTIHNIPGAGLMSNVQIATDILDMMKKSRSLITFVKDRPAHDRRYAMSGSTAASFPWFKGLEKTIAHYREHEAYYRKQQKALGATARIEKLLNDASMEAV